MKLSSIGDIRARLCAMSRGGRGRPACRRRGRSSRPSAARCRRWRCTTRCGRPRTARDAGARQVVGMDVVGVDVVLRAAPACRCARSADRRRQAVVGVDARHAQHATPRQGAARTSAPGLRRRGGARGRCAAQPAVSSKRAPPHRHTRRWCSRRPSPRSRRQRASAQQRARARIVARRRPRRRRQVQHARGERREPTERGAAVEVADQRRAPAARSAGARSASRSAPMRQRAQRAHAQPTSPQPTISRRGLRKLRARRAGGRRHRGPGFIGTNPGTDSAPGRRHELHGHGAARGGAASTSSATSRSSPRPSARASAAVRLQGRRLRLVQGQAARGPRDPRRAPAQGAERRRGGGPGAALFCCAHAADRHRDRGAHGRRRRRLPGPQDAVPRRSIERSPPTSRS